MKTKEELTAVKEKTEAMNEKVRKLTDEELHLCSGGRISMGTSHSRQTASTVAACRPSNC